MKKAMFVLGFAIVSLASNAQDVKKENIPASVTSAFVKLYPAAKEVKWEKENANYEAEFKVDGKACSVLMAQSGDLLETEVEISLDALPEQAKAHLKKDYAGKKIEEVAKITDSQHLVTYEVEIGGADIIFNAQGQYIKFIKK
jgi:hypothetical protein